MDRPIVVGVDGSSASREAIRVALEEARLRGTRVRAVHVWHVPEGLYGAGYAPTQAEVQSYEKQARALLDDAVAPFAGEAGVPVDLVVVQSESPPHALVAESASAAMLVVGSRGLHGLRELVLGSVSHACCQLAHCPVLVLPASARAGDGRRAETAASY